MLTDASNASNWLPPERSSLIRKRIGDRSPIVPRSGAAGGWGTGTGGCCTRGRHFGLVQGSVREADPTGRRAVATGAVLAVPTAVVTYCANSVGFVLLGEQW